MMWDETTVLQYWPTAQRSGDGWKTLCTVHSEDTPSLSLGVAPDGKLLANCFGASCPYEEIMRSVGLTKADGYPPRANGNGNGYHGHAHGNGAATVEAVAAKKKLPVEFLRGEVGLRDGFDPSNGRPRIEAPYFNSKGKELYLRPRYSIQPGKGFLWIKGTKPTVYGLEKSSAVQEAGRVVLVEGESDTWTARLHGIPCYGLPGSSMSKKLEPVHLAGVHEIYIVREPGEGGTTFTLGLRSRLASIGWKGTARVVSLDPHKDLSDMHVSLFENPGAFDAAWARAIEAAVPLESVVPDASRKTARQAPATPQEGPATITNYETVFEDDDEGKPKPKQFALDVQDILATIARRCEGWPKRMGDSLLIDHQGNPFYLTTPDDLFGYFHRKADVRWNGGCDDEGRNFLNRGEAFSVLRSHSEPIEEFRRYPLHPQPPGVYVSQGIPEDRRGDGTAFFNFVRRFCPASEVDAALIETLLLTFYWGGPPGSRPLFVVTGMEGIGAQSIGKSTLVQTLASVVGGAYSVHIGEKFDDSPTKQILSQSGMKHSVMLLDNLDGVVHSSEIAELVTIEAIDGRASHERQARRANYLTWCATGVTPALTADLASRSVMIALDRPTHGPKWHAETVAYAKANAEQIAIDAITMLREGYREPITAPHSRFPEWDAEVLGINPLANEILTGLAARRATIDADIEAVSMFVAALRKDAMQNSRSEYDPATLAEIWTRSTGVVLAASWVGRRLRDLRAKGKLPGGLGPKSKMHGCAWVVDLAEFVMEGSNVS